MEMSLMDKHFKQKGDVSRTEPVGGEVVELAPIVDNHGAWCASEGQGVLLRVIINGLFARDALN
jgi:hypothetical protein